MWGKHITVPETKPSQSSSDSRTWSQYSIFLQIHQSTSFSFPVRVLRQRLSTQNLNTHIQSLIAPHYVLCLNPVWDHRSVHTRQNSIFITRKTTEAEDACLNIHFPTHPTQDSPVCSLDLSQDQKASSILTLLRDYGSNPTLLGVRGLTSELMPDKKSHARSIYSHIISISPVYIVGSSVHQRSASLLNPVSDLNSGPAISDKSLMIVELMIKVHSTQ